MTKHCLICEKAIEVNDFAPHDATVWRTQGNYGSKVFDAVSDGVFLEAFVCDDCLSRKKQFIEEVVVRHTIEVVERRAPSF